MMQYIVSPASRARALALAGGVAISALLTGCAVGPDFLKPAPPETATYTPEATLPPTTASSVAAGEAQRFVQDQDIPGQWWTLFHSEALNALIDQALKTNPDLQAAQAALRQTQETALAARGPLFPSIDAQYNVTRQKISGASFGQSGLNPIFTLSTAQVSVSYLVDIWGATRRQIESAEAQAEAQRYQLEATYLTLTSNVVTAAVQEASLRAQIVATEDIISAETQQLNLLQRQFDLGGASKAAVLAQAATLAQAKAGLPVLQKQLAQQRNLLAVLAGRFPSDQPSQRFELASMQLPQDLPLSLPSKLVEQRPDIQAAEAAMHSASAQVGVATANLLPQLNLTGAFGVSGTGVDFNPSTGIWSIGAGLVQPIFRGGTLIHEKRAAVAAYDQTAAQYRGTVLVAFQNVADALRALQSDADALNAQLAAEQAAADSLDLSERQFQLGAISYTSLLDAERTLLQARVSLVQAQAARFADTAALFQALGGGWWNRTDVTENAPGGFAWP
jgi:NodT family efflux transporter outer membrane factor (OMF) lipoprotein